MINVNQITSQLAKMPDQALQQYASMHKNDPYTMALALAESNRRKEMRGAAHAQQGEQPKVVDQEVAGMLPEEQGIGQLPAPNIQGMAGGGIVAFDEGGEVPRYNGEGGSQIQMFNQLPSGSFGLPQAGAVENQPWAQRKMDEIAAKVQAGTASPQEKAWISTFGGDAMSRVSARQQQAIYKPAPDQLGGETARLAAQAKPVAASTATDKTTLLDKALPTDKTAPTPTTPGLPGLGGFEKKFLDMLSKGEVSKEDRMKELTDINKPVLEKMTTLIDENKNKLKTEGEQNFYMSLIQGGLAAAGASGPNALQNLAQGFEKGAASYGEGLKDLRKAARENTKMELSMAEYEASGKKEALKSYYDHQDKMQGFKAQGLASIMGHEISASAAAAHAGAQERLISRIGSDPKFASAYNQYLTSGAEAKLMPQLAAQYAKDPMKLEMLKQTDPMQYQQIKAYLSQQMVPAAINAPAGNVRP